MTLPALLILLKYLGAIISGLYGIYATLTDFSEGDGESKRLTRKGYFGIGLLVLSFFLTIFTSVVSDLNVANEQIVEHEKEASLLARLSEQMDLTQELLVENNGRVDYFELKIFVGVNPYALKTIDGKPLITDDKGLYSSKQDALRANYSVAREALFRQWELNIDLSKNKKNGVFLYNTRIRRQVDDELFSFVISHPDGSMDGKGVQCWLVYRFPPNRSAGFRSVDDFNDALLEVKVEGDSSVMEVTTVRFDLDVGSGLKPIFIQNPIFREPSNFLSTASGEWYAKTTVPSDHF